MFTAPMTAVLLRLPLRRFVLIAGLAVAGGLAACSSADRLHVPGQADYRQAYPIRSEVKTIAAVASVDSVLEDGQRLPADFINTYRRRGRGPLTIVLPDAAGPRGLQAAEVLGWWLDGQGVEAVAVRAAPGVAGADVADGASLTVFFRGHVALVSECGDWTGETGFNPTGRPHTNFGCAYQRNIGMMLSDPGDLVEPRDFGGFSGARSATVVGKWAAGEYTGSAQPPTEQGAISGAIGSK